MTITPIQLVTVPLISALVGWLTNLLAVRMLFRPRRSIGLGPLRLQGLVPRRQAELAASIGHTVERHLISHEDVRRILAQPEAQAGIDALVRERVSQFLDQRLKSIHPMVGMFLTGSTRDKLQAMLLAEVEGLIPELGERMLDNLEKQMNFQQIVEEKVRSFDLDRLEGMILEISRRELRAIELLGGVLGFVIGLIQVGILWL